MRPIPLGPLVLGALLAVTLAEVAVFALAVHLTGNLPPLAALVGMVFLGIWMLRRARLATSVGNHVQQNLAEGRPPLEGAGFFVFTAISAVLFIVPGFLSDAAGLLLFIPALRRFLAHKFLARPRDAPPPPPPPDDDPDVIDV